MRGFDLLGILLLIFTFVLVESDRAFSRKNRRRFELVFAACFLMNVCDDYLSYNNPSVHTGLSMYMLGFVWFLRVIVVVHIIMIGVFYRQKNKREISDILLVVFAFVTLVSSSILEGILDNHSIVSSCLTSLSCVYYFYLVTKTFKRDRLTGLLLRHNLSFELEDNKDKSYDLVLIDVDNFKLINDKYGHDKGDDALVTVVNTTLGNLPKGCRMYRFGGDEFIILSQKVTTEALESALIKTNEVLSENDYRISYGIVRHNAGTDSKLTIIEADKAMYENKRLIKSEDIWDDMTGLYNLRGFVDELDSFRKNTRKEKHDVCLVGVDVERLSNINKGYGYTEGNLVIRVLAKTLKSCLRGRDFIGHLGSDEFVAALECSSEEDEYIISFISQLQELMDNSFELSSKEYSVKINIDRLYIDHSMMDDSEELVNSLLYFKQEEKDNRRKNDITEAEKEYNEEEDALVQDILNNNRLQYAFQPIVSAKDGKIVAYESLMRSDTETMVSPLTILKYADRNKRSYDVEKLTMFNTLSKFANSDKITENIKIFINAIPGHLLNEVDFDLLRAKFQSILPRMVVEITEQRDIDDDSLAILNSRRDKGGFTLAIDDYGSGCSNTNNLLRYMPSVVKIDRLLITGIDKNAKKQFFVKSIISFAKENDMQTLAEGVETESELKAVIRLGIDMVQGYVAAKPSIDIITEIPDNIKKVIIKENLKAGESQRMVYTATDRCELSVVQLAMEDYSQLNVSTDTITLNGNGDYSADMIIKVKENTDCNMILSNVCLNSVDGRPCIEIGENSNLVLNLEGNNKFNVKGIHVPESSSILIIGGGSLTIDAKGHECYGIGTDTQIAFGSIELKNSGIITINIDGEECTGIGGGTVEGNSEIKLSSGTVNINVAGVNAVGIGSHKGSVPITSVDTDINATFRVNRGALIGSLNGEQCIDFRNFAFDFSGSGTEVAVIGTYKEAKGKILMNAGSMDCRFKGHNIFFVGGESGDVDIDITHCSIMLHGEGDNINGFGTMDSCAKLKLKECNIDVTINASAPLPIGSREKEISYIGPGKVLKINGDDIDIFEV